MKRSTYLLFCLFLSTVVTLAQNRTVTGVVISAEDNEPVIGASIVVDGTTTGTITTFDGTFSLEVPANATKLIISYIGMRRMEMAITDNMRIVMEPDAQALDEVVITAMGISREKKSLGYAIQEVNADDLTQAGQLSLTSSLTGKIAGVQVNQFGGAVGSSARISIRGNSSLAEDQQPLIVVDGVPISNQSQRSGDNYYNGVDYGSGLNDINPEDIESITVLKGGSAALYGMRAGNGVLLITTKSGRKANGVTVTYDGSITMDRISTIPKLQNSYGQGFNGDEYHWQTMGGSKSYQDYALTEGYAYGGINEDYDESWGPRLDIGLKLPQFDSPIVDGKYQATDWVSRPNNIKDFFRTGYSMNHTVSVLSSSEKANIRASLSYRDQAGTVPNTDQKRYTGQINSDVTISNQVKFDVNATYTRTESDNLLGQGYGSNNPINGLILWSARQVNMKSLKANWDQKDDLGNYTYYNWIDYYHMNPYFTVYENTNSYQRDRFFGKTSVFYQPFDFLKFEGRMGFDYFHSKSFERHYIDRGDFPEGGFEQRMYTNTELNLDFLASFNKTFGEFNIAAMAGTNYRDVNWEENRLGANALTVLGVYTMGNASGSPVAYMDHRRTRSNSIFASASVGWRNQLYFDMSARNDWDSTIKDSFFYPAFSLSWIATESFEWLQNDILSFLKLRGGWAEIGSATTPYRNRLYYRSEEYPYDGVPQMYKSNEYPNSDLKPESIKTWEIGVDVGFFDDRLHVDLAYYYKTTTNQILAVPVSHASGYGTMLINAGKIRNKGTELQIRGDILRSRNGFNWTSTLNFSKDKSMIKSLHPDAPTYRLGWTWGISHVAMEGKPWGTLIGETYARTDDGAIMVNEQGLIVKEDEKEIGQTVPDFLMGWTNDFSIKNFSFGFLLDFRKGGDLWSQSMAHGYGAGTAKYTVENGIRERAIIAGIDIMTDERFVMQDANGNWVANTIETNAQTWFRDGGVSQMYVFDGSYLKLREAHFTYLVPNKFLRKTNYISRATVSLIGSNLALLWVHKSNTMRLDPEAGGVSSDTRGVGYEQASVPSSRSFGLKVNLTF